MTISELVQPPIVKACARRARAYKSMLRIRTEDREGRKEGRERGCAAERLKSFSVGCLCLPSRLLYSHSKGEILPLANQVPQQKANSYPIGLE